MVTFSNTPTYQSDEPIDLGVSDDGEAWTLTFSGFEITVGGTNRGRLAEWSPEPDSGEGYNDRDDCEHGIDLVKSQAPSAQVQDLT